jgi:hypothetical protein
MVHSGGPAISSLLVGWNIVGDDKAALIAGLLVALASPLAAYPEAENNFRKWLYGVIAAVQAVLIGVVGVVDSPIVDLCGSALAILGGMVASANTTTSTGGIAVKGLPPDTKRTQIPVSVSATKAAKYHAESSSKLSEPGWRGL